MSNRTTDPRIVRILELLEELVEESPGEDLSPLVPGQFGREQWSEADLWLTSATDLLVPWSPSALIADDHDGFWTRPAEQVAPDSAAGNIWDDYLERRAEIGCMDAQRPDAELFSSRESGGRSSWSPSAITIEPDAIDPTIAKTAEDELPDDIAQTATDCLFDFVHALGRHDMDAAMSTIANDFHTVQDDHEIDRETLRLKLEYFLGQKKSGHLSVSVARVPEPINHPLGVLIHAIFQVDYAPYDSGARETTVDERIVLICEQPNGNWLIGALAPVEI